MPIFIYGMYKDAEGGLHAAVYDTSNLWREDDKTVPLLRNVPGWDQDFRRVVWNFFQATLRPDLAAAETLQIMKASKRLPPAPFQFEFYPDGCPILVMVDTKDGKGMNGGRMQEVFREFLRAHYSLAVGQEKRSPPWTSLASNASKFFEDGMLPDKFQFQDPSHITGGMLGIFYKHVIDMQNTVPPVRFRFSHYETGSGENRQYHPAVYNGTVEPAVPRRQKKGVAVPDFEDPPSPEDDSPSLPRSSQTPDTAPRTATSPFAAALAAGLEAVRTEMVAKASSLGSHPVGSRTHRGLGEGSATAALHSEGRASPSTLPGVATAPRQPPALDTTPWIDAEIDAATHIANKDYALTDNEFFPDFDADEGSDDEVENVLGEVLDSEAASLLRSLVPSFHPPPPLPQAPPTTAASSSRIALSQSSISSTSAALDIPLLSPNEAGTSPTDRLEFLENLADDAEYVNLLRRLHDTLLAVTPVRAQNPVFWGTWGHKSPHIPMAIHGSDKKVTQLMQWIMKDRESLSVAADAQRFCLVVGITLRDLSLLSSVDGTSIWPTHVPTFMACSSLEGVSREIILQACEDAFTGPEDADDVVPVPKGKGKGKGKGKALGKGPSRAPVGTADVDAAAPSAPLRRLSRSIARK